MKIESVFIVKKLNSENDPIVAQIAEMIEDVCSKLFITVLKDVSELGTTSLIIAIGGDGTVLYSMKLTITNPVLGINLGKVGFLADLNYSDIISHGEFYSLMAKILTRPDDNLVVTQRAVLGMTQQCGIFTNIVQDGYAVNEFTFSNIQSDSMIEYHIEIDGYDAGIHKANSVIISSPTGSTAYNLSAGGALMMPEGGAMQITPVAPIKLTSRPIVVPPNHDITIQLLNPANSIVRADGQILNHVDLNSPIDISVCSHRANLCHMKDWNFFDVLMEKLNWEKN